MKKFKRVASKLQYLGLLGLIGVWLNIPGAEFICLFGLLVFVNSGFIIQSLLILLSLIYFKVVGVREDIDATKGEYSLPFKGEWFTVNGGITKEDSHSWGIVPQRYAYDFFILDDSGKSFKGDRKKLDNYYCYGKDIVAPLDGIVVEIKDKFEDTPIMKEGQVGCEAADVRGNYVVIKHENSEYSLIAHMLKNSIQVKVRDRVARGQVVGKCGNSGNTSEPHIHYQVQSGKSFYISPGLPIIFKNIEVKEFEKSDYARVEQLKKNTFARNISI